MFRVLALVLLFCGGAHAVQLDELITCHTVERRRPVDERAAFSLDDKQMYIWLRIRDAEQIELRWHRDGRFVVRDRLKSTSSDWTTWVRRRFRPGDRGRWRVEVSSGETQLGAVEFSVGEALPEAGEAPEASGGPNPPDPELDAPPTGAPASLAPPLIDPPDTCRVALNLRTAPLDQAAAYAVADVRFGAVASIDHTPGLLVHDGARLHALAVRRRRQGARAWDELMSQALGGDAATQRWKTLPGTQPLPAPGQLREDNALTVMSILGPYLGIHARLAGQLDGRPFDNSRFLTTDSTGALVDLRTLVGAGLEIMVGRLTDAERFDYRRMALMPTTKGLTARFADKSMPLFSAPPGVRAVSPDGEGIYRRGRCAVKLAGHRVAASYDGAPFREVRAPGLLPYALLGVIWLDPSGPAVILPMERARQRFARLP